MKRRASGWAMALGCAVLLGSGDLAAADLKAHLLAALAAPEGQSDGELSGPMAELFQAQTRSSGPVRVEVRTVRKSAQAGCARLQATLLQDEVPTREGKRVAFAVRYELNLCRDGQPPREGGELVATGRGLSGGSPGRQAVPLETTRMHCGVKAESTTARARGQQQATFNRSESLSASCGKERAP